MALSAMLTPLNTPARGPDPQLPFMIHLFHQMPAPGQTTGCSGRTFRQLASRCLNHSRPLVSMGSTWNPALRPAGFYESCDQK